MSWPPPHLQVTLLLRSILCIIQMIGLILPVVHVPILVPKRMPGPLLWVQHHCPLSFVTIVSLPLPNPTTTTTTLLPPPPVTNQHHHQHHHQRQQRQPPHRRHLYHPYGTNGNQDYPPPPKKLQHLRRTTLPITTIQPPPPQLLLQPHLTIPPTSLAPLGTT